MKFKKLGIALSGGGGKGAYQIGVWKALKELGMDTHVAAIAGTSVGALNGAMMAQGKYELAERLWRNVDRHNLLTIEGADGIARCLAERSLPGQVLARIAGNIASKGLFKRDGLQAMIAEGVDTQLLANAAVPLTVTWHHGRTNRIVYRTLRDPAIVADGLLASAALPMIFDAVQIDGEHYSDGGFYWGIPDREVDNTPIRPLQEAGCDTVIVVGLSQDDLTIAPQDFPGMRIIPLVPKRALGNVMSTLDFSNDGAARRIEQGYRDASELLKHLDMFLASGEHYERLWSDVTRSAAEERATDDTLRDIDGTHRDTIASIADFDRIVSTDKFDRPLEAAPEDDGPTALELDSAALLADLDRARIHTNVERFMKENGRNTQVVESAVLDALAALAPVTGRASYLRDGGSLSRLLGMLTGKNQTLSADNQHALAEGQYALLRLVNTVQQQGSLSLEFSCALQNRLQGALQEMARQGQRHNEDLVRVYRSMAKVHSRLRERLMEHGKRLDALERQSRLHNWLLHPNRARHRGLRLRELDTTLRIATLANDFLHLTGGAWTVDELLSAKEMCYTVGLGDDVKVHIGAFFKDLLGDRESGTTLTRALIPMPDRAPAGAAADWLLALRNRRLDEVTGHALACWNYGEDTELAAWDLLVELLYHMKAAGLAPVKHDSKLAALKARWISQLDAVEALVEEGVLPAAFRREAAPVRRAIEAFKLKVPLVGKFNVGKSTLLNCWIGQDVQDVDLKACTSIPAELHPAEPGREKLVVHWAPVAPETVAVLEEFPDAYMSEQRLQTFARGRVALHMERHCDIDVLRRSPDLIVVDTPGLGANDPRHHTALAHYLGEGVVFILCVNRGQVGIDELAFVRRQRQLGQEFSLLVCQEDLNNPSEREQLRRTLAQQAGVGAGQLVRGCSAWDNDLAGFEDILAHIEQRKFSLFESSLRPMLAALLQRAERLLARSLDDTSSSALLAQKTQLQAAADSLRASLAREETDLLADCAGSVARAVVADAGGFIRARRSAYAERVESKDNITALLLADAQNAYELSVERHLVPRIRQTAEALETQAASGEAAALDFSPVGAQQADPSFGKAGAMGASAMAGGVLGAAIPAVSFGSSVASMSALFGTAGSVLPGAGTAIGALLGVAAGAIVWGMGRRSNAAEQVNAAIEAVCQNIEQQAPMMLEAQARAALAGLREQVEARLRTDSENLDRIERQLQAEAQQKDEVRARSGKALASLRQMLTDGAQEQDA